MSIRLYTGKRYKLKAICDSTYSGLAGAAEIVDNQETGRMRYVQVRLIAPEEDAKELEYWIKIDREDLVHMYEFLVSSEKKKT